MDPPEGAPPRHPMKIVSFNCRGLARPKTKLTLCRMIVVEPIEVIFLQENLGIVEAISHLLESMLPIWIFLGLEADGRSGRVALGYNSCAINLRNSWGGSGHIGVDLFIADLGMEIRSYNVYGSGHHWPEYWDHFLSSKLLQKEYLIMGGDLNFSIGHSKSWGHQAQRNSLSDYFENALESHNLIDISSAKMHPTWRNNRIGVDSLARRLDRFLIKERLLDHARGKILKDREEDWRLRSRVIWLQEGDDNTKFYRKYENGRKAINTIWQLSNDQCLTVNTFPQLASLASSHYKKIYRAPTNVNLTEIIQVVQLFPRVVEQEDARELTMEVTLGELEASLKWFKKDKSPGLDGWPIELYLAFFDILGVDLLKVIEDSRNNSKMHAPFISTLTALIPKTNTPTTFDYYRLISLCNCIYKIMAKIIANRLRPILSKQISREQFAFLNYRQIHEVVGTT
eukprot:PITA_19805